MQYDMNTVRTRTLAWFDSRSSRERMLLIGLVVVLIIAGFIRFGWMPVANARADALADIARYESITARIHAAGDTLQPVDSDAALPAATRVTRSAASHELSIRRLEPEGTRLRLVLDDAPYDRLITWLADLQTNAGLVVIEANITRRPEPGFIAATLVLEG